jgi:hypothetical protein
MINATQPLLLPKGRAAKADVRKGLIEAGLPAEPDVVAGLVTEARVHLARRGVEEELRAELAALGRPVVELPLLPGGVDLAGLYRLAGALLGPQP